ncbi:MAG: hypothetical protein BIFFINMI_02013 [Phycisphaerae bacterium]|nr:hypothetical protein [Phycisphaerae bacterium]
MGLDEFQVMMAHHYEQLETWLVDFLRDDKKGEVPFELARELLDRAVEADQAGDAYASAIDRFALYGLFTLMKRRNWSGPS